MNPDMVTDIKKAKDTLVMNMNTGSKLLDKQGMVIRFGKARFDEEQMANIVGFVGTVGRYHITYNSTIEDTFNAHTEHAGL